MKNSNRNIIASGLLILGVFLIIGLIAGGANSSTNRCIETGCNNERASGSSYCYIHKPHNTGSSTKSGGNLHKSTDKIAGDDKSSGTSKAYTRTYSGSGTSESTRKYNTLNNDPADYDDPEEYADDAWGDDFDDWDEAYDYWEDY